MISNGKSLLSIIINLIIESKVIIIVIIYLYSGFVILLNMMVFL